MTNRSFLCIARMLWTPSATRANGLKPAHVTSLRAEEDYTHTRINTLVGWITNQHIFRSQPWEGFNGFNWFSHCLLDSVDCYNTTKNNLIWEAHCEDLGLLLLNERNHKKLTVVRDTSHWNYLVAIKMMIRCADTGICCSFLCSDTVLVVPCLASIGLATN